MLQHDMLLIYTFFFIFHFSFFFFFFFSCVGHSALFIYFDSLLH